VTDGHGSQGESPSVTIGSAVLLIEGRKPAAEYLAPILEERGFRVVEARTRREAWSKLQEENPAMIVLDTPSIRFSEQRFYAFLRQAGCDIPVLMLLPNGNDPVSGAQMRANLHYPFSPRKLINRVKRLIPDPDEEILTVGKITLYVNKRHVVCYDRETDLTPKQARLLEAFLRNPGKILTRAYLMKQVWDTEYLGDTRTLDVHIHWLRNAVENNPRRPSLLRTIRRGGYRLELPEE